jgi:hypothetical protein
MECDRTIGLEKAIALIPEYFNYPIRVRLGTAKELGVFYWFNWIDPIGGGGETEEKVEKRSRLTCA